MNSNPAITSQKRSWRKLALLSLIVMVLFGAVFIRTHPLVFNESFFSHAHCIKQVGLSFILYAKDHGGSFPFHTNGYGDALVLLMADYGDHPSTLTGPGYSLAEFEQALLSPRNVSEAKCGRVYVQGLCETNSPEIAIFFDKLPTPGGDHCHLLRRMRAALGREVWTIGGDLSFIDERRWAEFARNQIELLVKEGFDRATAEALYAERGKTP